MSEARPQPRRSSRVSTTSEISRVPRPNASDAAPVEASRVLREARQSAGLSQRALAGRSGGSARSIAGIESGAREPSVLLLSRLLAACGQQLDVQDLAAGAEPACAHLREHLHRSLTDRWTAAAEATGCSAQLHAALAATAATAGVLVLEPAASVPVWVPGAALDLPLVVEAHRTRRDRGEPPSHPELLVVRLRRQPLASGLVRLRAFGLLDLHLLHPAVLARQHSCRPWRPALLAAARLLHDEGAQDRAGRRAPPHRQPDEDEEARRLSHSLRYTALPRPRARDSRALRLGAPVSLPQWLDERGLPPLLGQRARW